MILRKRTILITGGGSGIGFETATLLKQNGNRVIIVGRDAKKLKAAADVLPGAFTIVCDITNEDQVDALVARIKNEFSNLSVLINNAGIAHGHHLANGSGAFDKAGVELATNFLATIRLTEKLLPILKKQKEAAIVAVSSVLALVPSSVLPTYSASKAALHSYMQSLRISLERTTAISVHEILPPLVDTEFSKVLPGEKMQAADVAKEIVAGIENGIKEIFVGKTKQIYDLFLASPQKALHLVNGIN